MKKPHNNNLIKHVRPIRMGAMTSMMALMLGATAVNAGQHTINLDIPTQTLADALVDFSTTTRIAVLTDDKNAALQNVISRSLAGNYDIKRALEIMLRDTGFEYAFIDDETVVVRPVGTSWGADKSGFQKISYNTTADYEASLEAYDEDENVDKIDEFSFEEIMVTATKRSESILDVPISMTAYTDADIEKLGIQKVEDFLLITPGVQYSETDDFIKTVSIRGLNDSGGGLFQTAGVTVDDATLVATYNGFVLTSRLFDIERVEVLRGPQGTLTGSNSVSGTINIITKKPKLDEVEGELSLDIGRYDTRVLRGVLNLPLTDTLALRAVAYTENSDGAVRNISAGGGGSTRNHWGGRLAVRWQPTDELTLDAAYSYEDQQFGAPNTVGLNEPSYTNTENDGQFWAEHLRYLRGIIDDLGADYDSSSFIRQTGNNDAVLYSDLAQYTKHKIKNLSLRANYDLGEHSVDLAYTHYEHDVDSLSDEDKTEFALLAFGWQGGPETNYAELKVNSDYDGPLNWVAGLSYMKEHRILDFFYDVTDAYIPYYDGEGSKEGLDLFSTNYYSIFDGSTLEEIESKAVFANAFYDISDRIHLSIGARLSFWETRTQQQYGLSEDFGPFDDTVNADGSEIDPRITLNYDLNDDVTTYLQFATSFRAGYGNVGRAVDLGIAEPIVQGERLKNYEIGIKGRFFDRRLTLAAALYYMDYSDMQVFNTETVVGEIDDIEYDSNANSAYAKGFELEGALIVTQGLILSGGLSYVKSRIDELVDGGVTYTDIPFKSVGPWTVDAALEYTVDVSDDMWGTLRADYSFRDANVTAFPWDGLGILADIPSYQTVDIRMGIHKEKWSVSAYATNIFNEIYWSDVFLDSGLRGPLAPYNPRTFGMRLTLKL